MPKEIKTPMSVSGSSKDIGALRTALDNAIMVMLKEGYDATASVLIEWRDIAKEQLKDELFEQQNPK